MLTKTGSCGKWGQGNLGQVADNVSGNLDGSTQATADLRKEWRNPSKIWQFVQTQITDQQVVIKKALRKHIGGKFAERAIQAMEKMPGGSAKGMVEAQIVLKSIYDGMTEEMVFWFNKMVVAKRAIAVDKHKIEIARSELKDKGFGMIYDMENKTHVQILNGIFDEVNVEGKKYGVVEYLGTDIKKGAKRRIKLKGFNDRQEATKFVLKQTENYLKDAEILHPGGNTAEEYEIFLQSLRKTDPDTYAKLDIKLKKYFDTYKEHLGFLHKEGIVSKRDYDNMVRAGDYSPRRYLKFFDPDIASEMLAGITTGSTSELNMDSANLLREYIIRLHSRIARNEANKELYYIAKDDPDNGMISIVDETLDDSEIEIGANFKAITAFVAGRKIKMMMPLEFGKSWLATDPAIDKDSATLFRMLSGAGMIRALATGYNPEFAITNLPRDLFFSWFRVREYSDHAWFAFPQMAKRMVETFADVWHTSEEPRGRAKEFLDEYGMMDFMTQQGEFGGKAWKHDKGIMKPLKTVGKMLSFVGSKTELWVRLALREQAIINRVAKNNGVETQGIRDEATWIARGYIDFSQGGKLVKGLDSFIPYLNAGMVATRGLFDTLSGSQMTGVGQTSLDLANNQVVGNQKAKNVAMAWWKMAQFFGLFAGSFVLNMMNNPEEWDKIEDSDKFKNLILFIPGLKDKGPLGKDIHGFAKIPLDQGQVMVANFVGLLMTGFMRETIGTEGDSIYHKIAGIRPDIFLEGMNYGSPVSVANLMPPSLKALIGYTSNLDLYRGGKIYRGPEMENLGGEMAGRTPFEHPALTMSAEKLNSLLPTFFGLIPEEPFSPARMKFVIDTFFVPSNSMVRGIGGLWDSYVSPQLRPEEYRKIDETIAEDVMAFYKKLPGVERVLEFTKEESVEAVKRNEELKFREAEKKSNARNISKGFAYKFNKLKDGDFETQDAFTRKEVAKIKEQKLDPETERKFLRRMKDAIKVKRTAGTLKSPRFWYTVNATKDPIVRANMLFMEMKRNPENRAEIISDLRRMIAVHPSYEKTRTQLSILVKKDRMGR